MNTHTKGPWTIPHFAKDDVDCTCGYVFAQGYMGSICEVSVSNGIESISKGSNDCPPLEEAKANARLIAAAPDLLAAAINALERLKEIESAYPVSIDPTLAELRQAIAKAMSPTITPTPQ